MKNILAKPIVKYILWITGIILIALFIYYIYKKVTQTTLKEDIKIQAQSNLPLALANIQKEKYYYDNYIANSPEGKDDSAETYERLDILKLRTEFGQKQIGIGSIPGTVKVAMKRKNIIKAITYFNTLIDDLNKGII